MDAATLTKAPVISIQDEAIDQLRAEYMPLVVSDLADKQQVAKVRKARLHVREIRIAAEKKHKELKADALAYGRACDAELNRIKGRLEPIESHLKAEEDKPKIEAERIAFEAAEAKKAMIRQRLRQLAEADDIALADDVADLTQEQFEQRLVKASMAKQARDEQAAAEAEARRVEQEKLDAERAEFERQKAEHAAEVAKLEAAKAEQAKAQTLSDQANERIGRPGMSMAVADANRKRANAAIDNQADCERLTDLAWKLEGIACPTLSDANKEIQVAVHQAIESVHQLVAKFIRDLA